MKRLFIILIGVGALLAAGNLPRGATEAAVQTGPPSPDGRDDNEEPPVAPHGLHFRWPAPAPTLLTRIADPVLPLTIVNLDDLTYVLQVRTREDAGSLQTRRAAELATATLPGRGSMTIPVRFGGDLPAELTHSGMLSAFVVACPVAGGACISGSSDPLFFHIERGLFVVYGEAVLCERFSCGALRAKVRGRERGTWRVMGGGPLLAARVHEERDGTDEDAVLVPGGER